MIFNQIFFVRENGNVQQVDDIEDKEPAFVPLCGRRNQNGLGLRISGYREGETQFGEWPHMCVVLKRGVINGQPANLYQSGASLIAPGVLLTAAHSVKGYKNPCLT